MSLFANNLKKIVKKTLIFFQLIILSPILFLLIFLRIFFKIKIVEIETRAIGHMSLPMEVFLCEILNNNNKSIYFAFRNKFIANKFLYHKIKRKFLVLPRIILEPIFLFFNYKFIYNLLGKKFTSDYRHWTKRKNYTSFWQEQDIYNVLPKTPPTISFTQNEINLGNKLLQKLRLNEGDTYVCIHHRTPHYYFKRKIINEFKYNIRDLRNENYFKTTNYLDQKNIKIVQMGEDIQNSKKDNKVIYYNKSKIKNDFLDIFLLFGCKFMISDGAGIANVPLMNRKKRMYINFAQIFSINLSDSKYTPYIMLKKFKLLNTGKYLPYSLVLEKKLSEIAYVSDLNKLGYDIEDNTDEEILNATKEMDYFLENKDYLNYDDYLEKKFNKILIKYNGTSLKYSKIPYSFLSKNSGLID